MPSPVREQPYLSGCLVTPTETPVANGLGTWQGWIRPCPAGSHPTVLGWFFPGVPWHPNTGVVATGDVTVLCRGIPSQHTPGGTAGSVAPSRIRLAALVEAAPVPAKGAQ